MVQKNLAYDHATYITRVQAGLGQIAAGAAGVSQKFIAFAALQVLSVTGTLFTAGTSTTTAWNGTATTTSVNGDSFSVIHIANSAAIGATPVLTTNTHGPYNLGLYNGTATAVQTAVSGAFVNVVLGTNTGVGVASPLQGGFNVNQGDQLYVVRGTDATAVSSYALEYNVLPLSNVTA
jgi:hypothetical protein